MDTLLISQAALEDALQILALQRLAYQSEAQLYNDWTIPPLTQTLAQLEEEFRLGLVLKAIAGGELLGSVRARATDGVVHIGRLIVAPVAQGRGIGSALLKAVESASSSAQRFEVVTGSRSESNIRLYQKHGYSITHHKALSPSVTLVFMSKPNQAQA